MKYGAARFVYGLAAVFLIMTGVGTVLTPITCLPLSGLKEIVSAFCFSTLAAAIPIGLGIFCLMRYRHWHKEAIRMKTKPEPVR